jgi:hypothetical protein
MPKIEVEVDDHTAKLLDMARAGTHWDRPSFFRALLLMHVERLGLIERKTQPDGSALIVDGPNYPKEDTH